MLAEYYCSIWAIWFLISLIIVQGFIATLAHRKQSQSIPGILDGQLGHQSFVFRSHRTHQNSLENVIQLLAPAALAIFVGVNSTLLATLLWTYAIARLLHMALYYAIATDKNPSPRTYFYLIGYLANLTLVGAVAHQLTTL